MVSHAKRTLSLIALGHLAIELSSQFLPIIYPVFIATLGFTYTQIGVIALVHGIGTSLVQPFFGYLSDHWNPRLMVVLSVVWIGTFMGLVGLTGSYLALVVVVGLGILGSAAFHPSAVSIASHCGGSRRGAATSVFSLGGTVGTALSPVLITFGLARMGMTGTVLLIPIALLAGALLYWQLGRLERTEEGRAAIERASIDRRTVVSLVLIVLAVMCLAWFQWSFRSYLPTWLQEQGQTLVFASQVMFIFAIALGVGTLLGGILSDRLGRWQLLAISLALLGPAVWVFLSAPASLHVPLVVVLGVLVGATFPISIVMAQETWPSGVGVASGLVMGLGWVPGGIGASFTGMLADRTSLTSAMYTLVVPALLSTVCVLAYAVVQRPRPVPEPLSVAERP